jgi:hypothetical protein
MNKIKYMTGVVAAMIITFAGCSDFLAEENKAGITNEKLYVTEQGYQTLRINAYTQLRTIYRIVPQVLVGGTDLYQFPRGNMNNGLFNYVDLFPTNGDVRTFYRDCYNALQAINTAVYYLDGAEISANLKDLYAAEYNFLKGFIHFLLAEQFGGVAINDEYTTRPRMEMPRASLEETYAYIIEKMTAALNSAQLPQTDKTGQICKDIVNHYLAKVYLTRGWDLGNQADFTQAKAYASAVMSSRGDLRLTFKDLWIPNNDNNDEMIFSVQYSDASLSSSTNGNNQESVFGPYLGGSERNHKYMSQTCNPSWSIHSWFPKNDVRYEETFMLTIWNEYHDYYDPGKSVPGVNRFTAIYPRAWEKLQEMFEDYLLLTDGEDNGQFRNATMTRTVGADQILVPGDIKVQTASADGRVSPEDRTFLGTIRPKLSFGLNNRFSYQGIEFNVFLYGKIGSLVASDAVGSFKYQGLENAIMVDYWTPENQTNAYPRPDSRSSQTKAYYTTLRYIKGDFLKIRDITLAYNLPRQWFSSLSISSVRIYATAKNWITFCDSRIKPFDIERHMGGSSSVSFPMTKDIVFGINLNF